VLIGSGPQYFKPSARPSMDLVNSNSVPQFLQTNQLVLEVIQKHILSKSKSLLFIFSFLQKKKKNRKEHEIIVSNRP